MKTQPVHSWNRFFSSLLIVNLLLPMLVMPASAQIFTRKQNNNVPRQGMSMGKKAVLLGGAALLYFLWRKHQANAQRAQNSQHGQTGSMANNGRSPQLYRSRNGGIYYRDANGKPVWLTVPNQQVEVPYEEVQQYAPNYRRYRGEAPAAPAGYRTQPFSEFDRSLGAPTGPGMLR